MTTTTEIKSENAKGQAKERDGVVVSNKMDKTIVVAVTRQRMHPDYHKYVTKTMRYYAHDEKNECKKGDQVRIVETRPISKLKRWKVKQILVKAVGEA